MATPRSSSEAFVVDGRAVADRIRKGVADRVRANSDERGRTPGLATILVGDDPASATYVAAKRRACREALITSFHHELPADTEQRRVLELIDRLNDDPAVSGILCQLPVPAPLDGVAIANRISPDKDVDGLTTVNAGRLALGLPGLRPCTPLGVMALLREAAVHLRGAHAVVVGRSNLFGKPMAQLLTAQDATVTLCHSHTRDLREVCREADVLIAAAGRPRLVGPAWIKPGATVVDVGINRVDGSLVGDVDFAAARGVAAAITPVPGGVGPMTIAMLLENTLQASAS